MTQKDLLKPFGSVDNLKGQYHVVQQQQHAVVFLFINSKSQ